MEEHVLQNIQDYQQHQTSLLSFKMARLTSKPQSKQLFSNLKNDDEKLKHIEKNQELQIIFQYLKKQIKNRQIHQMQGQNRLSHKQNVLKHRMSVDQSKNYFFKQLQNNKGKNTKHKRQSQRLQTEKLVPLTFKFIKVVSSPTSSRKVICQDKSSTVATLDGEGILCMSNGTKIRGKWKAGQPVGQLEIFHSVGIRTNEDIILEDLPLNRKWSDKTSAKYIQNWCEDNFSLNLGKQIQTQLPKKKQLKQRLSRFGE